MSACGRQRLHASVDRVARSAVVLDASQSIVLFRTVQTFKPGRQRDDRIVTRTDVSRLSFSVVPLIAVHVRLSADLSLIKRHPQFLQYAHRFLQKPAMADHRRRWWERAGNRPASRKRLDRSTASRDRASDC